VSSISWVALWSAVAIIGISGIISSANSIRFQRRVDADVQKMLATARDPGPIHQAALERMPHPVRRYLVKAIGARRNAVRTVRLRQDGTFRSNLSGPWYSLRATQHFAADPPGFIWHGRVRLAPGLWIDARGPELDQGALLRLLGELVVLPTAYLDDRYIRWAAVDDRHAMATLAVSGHQVIGLVEFGADDLPVRFTAHRFRDLGGGRSVLTPFVGETRDYRDVNGLLVPHEMIGSWIVDGTPMPYARFRIVAIDFDVMRILPHAERKNPEA
jgi:hypothetical protein